VVELVNEWQAIVASVLGRRGVFAADEYYLLAGRPFPPAGDYEGFPMHEDGVGMARAFELELLGHRHEAIGVQPGFFAWVDGAPAEGYRARRSEAAAAAPAARTRPDGAPGVTIVTGEYGAPVLEPLLARLDAGDVDVLPVPNRFFGGNIAVTGLLVGEDVAAALASRPADRRYLLPDVCLSGGAFLDGRRPSDLPRPVEVVPTDGLALRRALGLDG
jgi:NifB/MoaA-like Fe-S oxidoreductase